MRQHGDDGVQAHALTPEALRRIVDRVVEAAQPDKIILFGSAARGLMGPDSDVDLLVVKSGDYHRRRLAQLIQQNLWGIEEAADIVVVKPEDVERADVREMQEILAKVRSLNG